VQVTFLQTAISVTFLVLFGNFSCAFRELFLRLSETFSALEGTSLVLFFCKYSELNTSAQKIVNWVCLEEFHKVPTYVGTLGKEDYILKLK
jgi:hypothetical protein